MAGGGYMELGIKGDSRDDGHKDWIDIMSFNADLSRPANTGGNATTRNQAPARFGDIVVVKAVDSSSPKLQEAVADGKVRPKVKFDFVTSYGGGKRLPYLQYELTNALVTTYQMGGSCEEGAMPTESISLNYEEIKVTYHKRDKNGSDLGKVEYAWKVEEGVSA